MAGHVHGRACVREGHRLIFSPQLPLPSETRRLFHVPMSLDLFCSSVYRVH